MFKIGWVRLRFRRFPETCNWNGSMKEKWGDKRWKSKKYTLHSKMCTWSQYLNFFILLFFQFVYFLVITHNAAFQVKFSRIFTFWFDEINSVKIKVVKGLEELRFLSPFVIFLFYLSIFLLLLFLWFSPFLWSFEVFFEHGVP